MEFKGRIKFLRIEKNMTQAQLAVYLGKGEGAVRMWEIGRSKPDVDTLIKLAKYFNCTTDYLLGLSDLKTRDVDDKDLIITNLDARIKEAEQKYQNTIELIHKAIQ